MEVGVEVVRVASRREWGVKLKGILFRIIFHRRKRGHFGASEFSL